MVKRILSLFEIVFMDILLVLGFFFTNLNKSNTSVFCCEELFHH